MIDLQAARRTARRSRFRLLDWSKVAATLTISAGLFWLAVGRVDLERLPQALAEANYLDVVLAVAVYFLDLGLRATRWQVLLASTRLIPIRRLYPVLAIGYMANNLLPGRIGELSRAYLVSQREGVSASTVLASVAIERVIDGLTVLALLLGALALLPAGMFAGASWVLVLTRLAAVTFGLGMVVSIALVLERRWWTSLLARLVRILPERLGDRVVQLVDRFIAGLVVLQNPRRLAETFALSVLIWVVGAAAYALVAAAFGIFLSPVEAVATIGVVNLATAIPQAPAGLGAFEAAAQRFLVVLGVAETAAFGVTIVLHTVLVLPVVVVGLAFLWQADLSLRALWRAAQAPAESAAAERST